VRKRQHAGARGAVDGLDLELEQRFLGGSESVVRPRRSRAPEAWA
jgi:hypothetical protein